MRRPSPLLVLLVQIACGDGVADTDFVDPDTTGSSSSGSSTSGVTPTSTGSSSGDGTTTTTTTSTSRPATDSDASSSSETTAVATTSSTGGTTTTSDSGESGPSSEGESSSTGEAVPGCDDGIHNQDETGTDCGGAICDACANDEPCLVDVDCLSGWCDQGVCGDPGCVVDADCDAFDADCADASCNLETNFCAVTPILEGMPCEDGLACSVGELCTGGACSGGAPPDCSGLDSVCGIGVCDEQGGGCVPLPLPDQEGMPCDDGFVCTPGDKCQDGLCGSGGPGYLWFEDFADADPAWELGAGWEIGPAVASPNGKNGIDPGDDHTPTGDAMLAGTAIGGLLPAGDLPKACMTTPPIDAAGLTPLWLNFWRHLHTDYYPFISNTVEVWDGDEWITLEVGYNQPGINDPAWLQVAYDLAPHANAALQARICYAKANGAKASAGWSLDDVTIGAYVCTPDG